MSTTTTETILDRPLRTERLVLRAATEDDVEATWELRQLESVNGWLTGTPADLDNDTSWRLKERVGMRREVHAVRESLHRSGQWLDTVAYAVLADEWSQRTSPDRSNP